METRVFLAGLAMGAALAGMFVLGCVAYDQLDGRLAGLERDGRLLRNRSAILERIAGKDAILAAATAEAESIGTGKEIDNGSA